MTETLEPLLVIVGPTASGKSALAVEVAEALDGEVVSADAFAVYRGLDIGTDKPPPRVRSPTPPATRSPTSGHAVEHRLSRAAPSSMSGL